MLPTEYHLRDLAVTFRFGETVASVEPRPDGAIATLRSGKKILADTVLYSAGRQGVSDELNLAAAGLSCDDRGRISVDEFLRTAAPHIYPVGEYHRLAGPRGHLDGAGRLAAHHACGEPLHAMGQLQPVGIYSIPEISFIGEPKNSSPPRTCPSRSESPAGRSSATLTACWSSSSRRRIGRC